MTEKTDLVLVPGLLCTRALWAPQIKDLGAAARIHVADHTGHDTMARIAASILATAPPRFALAGLSMGGYIAFEIMRQAPMRVTKLCLLDTSARADTPERPAQRRAMVAAVEQAKSMQSAMDAYMPLLVHPDRVGDPAFRSVVLAMMEELGPAVFRRQIEAIIGRVDSRPSLAAIKCPVMVIVGREDVLTPVEGHEEIARGIKGSRLEIVSHCGHLSTLERPERVSDLMAEWLAE